MLDNKKISLFIIIIMIISLSIPIVYANETAKEVTQDNNISVLYNSHIQDIGWEKDFSVKDGAKSGTEGQSKRLEAIKIKATNLPAGVSIQYQVHIQDIGWQDWKKDGELAGTTGKGKRLEAIRIYLKGTDDYTIQYRTHVQDIGWQDWKNDGELAGTTGQSKRLESIEIRIVSKKNRAKIVIETSQTQFYSSGIKISGWKTSNYQSSTIEAYIDGKKVGADVKYSARNDILTQLEGCGGLQNNPNPGYNLKINTQNIAEGNHELELKLVNSKGNVLASQKKTIKIDKTNIAIKYQAHVQKVGWRTLGRKL